MNDDTLTTEEAEELKILEEVLMADGSPSVDADPTDLMRMTDLQAKRDGLLPVPPPVMPPAAKVYRTAEEAVEAMDEVMATGDLSDVTVDIAEAVERVVAGAHQTTLPPRVRPGDPAPSGWKWITLNVNGRRITKLVRKAAPTE